MRKYFHHPFLSFSLCEEWGQNFSYDIWSLEGKDESNTLIFKYENFENDTIKKVNLGQILSEADGHKIEF